MRAAPKTARRCARRILPLTWVALLGLLAAGCGAAAAADFPTAAELPSDRRRPDGVAIDPASAPPPAADHADAAEGVVTLRTPLGVDRALAVISDLFNKVVAEDVEGLGDLFTRDALALQAGPGGQGQTPSAVPWWEQRFRRLDYGKLAGEPIYRASEVEIYRAQDVLAAPRPPALQTDALGDDDVLIRVPILAARLGAERFFGDEIVVWLRREGAAFKIYRLLEDFQLP